MVIVLSVFFKKAKSVSCRATNAILLNDFQSCGPLQSRSKTRQQLFDGEIVALDENGVQCFEQLQNHTRDCSIIYFAFDLVFLNGESLTDLSLIQRKANLQRILPKSLTGRLRFTDHVLEKGLDLFAGLEAEQTRRHGREACR
jgi:ATP-dependent DNA ligase